ncbi:glycosyltransferase [Sinomonas sp. ASV486]|uniref:glycosyltransferase family 2 protein n=1 Tax=Sinomonas sp. ASV486 TaxID=3051170 RepID=UPI0027DCFE91|nr:glycosyltransferase [Sinomonas sp. ASV486]MDQ4490350.1 glycosyltransferase [Sinomonas sp. ASV486]
MQKLRARPLNGRPVVSVVIPCYNYGAFLPMAVDSVLGQPGVDVEVIVVDDASSDGSGEVARSLARHRRQVTAVVHEVNMGHIATYNDGLARCTGDYVALLSADDLLAPGSLARAGAVFERFPGVGLVYGHAPSFEREPPRMSGRGPVTWSVWAGHEWTWRVCAGGVNVISNPEAVVRRAVIEAIGGYERLLPHTADLHFWLRAASVSDVARVNGRHQGYYRIHGQNMHFESDDVQDLMERSSMFEFLYAPRDPGTSRAAELYAASRRAIASEALLRAAREYDHGRGHGIVAGRFCSLAADQGVDLSVLPAWEVLRKEKRRTGLGPAGRVLSLASRAGRRVKYHVQYERWRRTGVWSS